MDLISLLRCPISKLRLIELAGSQLEERRSLWSAQVLEEGKLSGILITEDNKTLYPIIDGIPALLREFARPVAGLENKMEPE